MKKSFEIEYDSENEYPVCGLIDQLKEHVINNELYCEDKFIKEFVIKFLIYVKEYEEDHKRSIFISVSEFLELIPKIREIILKEIDDEDLFSLENEDKGYSN